MSYGDLPHIPQRHFRIGRGTSLRKTPRTLPETWLASHSKVKYGRRPVQQYEKELRLVKLDPCHSKVRKTYTTYCIEAYRDHNL